MTSLLLSSPVPSVPSSPVSSSADLSSSGPSSFALWADYPSPFSQLVPPLLPLHASASGSPSPSPPSTPSPPSVSDVGTLAALDRLRTRAQAPASGSVSPPQSQSGAARSLSSSSLSSLLSSSPSMDAEWPPLLPLPSPSFAALEQLQTARLSSMYEDLFLPPLAPHPLRQHPLLQPIFPTLSPPPTSPPLSPLLPPYSPLPPSYASLPPLPPLSPASESLASAPASDPPSYHSTSPPSSFVTQVALSSRSSPSASVSSVGLPPAAPLSSSPPPDNDGFISARSSRRARPSRGPRWCPY
ncbi:MAG: hypothetical protein M1826_005893 [Phylliscum demangeonii]|nr:MAG: hypothetical protein M1826_005893 [Phylliscum demangeonii]